MAEWSEDSRAYNGAVAAALWTELIGVVERKRLEKLPWARSVAIELVQRIMNLRIRVEQLEAQIEAMKTSAGRGNPDDTQDGQAS